MPKAPRGIGSVPPPSFLYKNGEFLCIPKLLREKINPRMFLTYFFQKRHPNQNGGCPDTLDTRSPLVESGLTKHHVDRVDL